MEYEGKLYGKVGKHYIPLIPTTHDIERLRQSVGRSGEDYLLEIDRHKRHIEYLQKEIDKYKAQTNFEDEMDKAIKFVEDENSKCTYPLCLCKEDDRDCMYEKNKI